MIISNIKILGYKTLDKYIVLVVDGITPEELEYYFPNKEININEDTIDFVSDAIAYLICKIEGDLQLQKAIIDWLDLDNVVEQEDNENYLDNMRQRLEDIITLKYTGLYIEIDE